MTTKLGILSDTHGQVAGVEKAAQLFREHGVSIVIHCGDIEGTQIISLLAEFDAHYVYGNKDAQADYLEQDIPQAGGTLHGLKGELEIEGKRIFFLHGHHDDDFQKALQDGQYDMICYGHTHVAELKTHKNTILLNPGAFTLVTAPSVAVVTLPEMTVESFTL